MSRPPIERFVERIDVDPVTGCWTWTGAHNENGYGIFCPGGRGRVCRAHRWSYEFFVSPIPDGLELDHLCRNRGCVNPDHLEAVTRAENILRGDGPKVQRARHAAQTHCKHGHEFNPENTRITRAGRRCRACARRHARESYRRRAAA